MWLFSECFTFLKLNARKQNFYYLNLILQNSNVSQEVCVTNETMPAGDSLCEKLVSSGKYPPNVDIVYVKGVGKNKDRLSRCNPPLIGRHGQFQTKQDFLNINGLANNPGKRVHGGFSIFLNRGFCKGIMHYVLLLGFISFLQTQPSSASIVLYDAEQSRPNDRKTVSSSTLRNKFQT